MLNLFCVKHRNDNFLNGSPDDNMPHTADNAVNDRQFGEMETSVLNIPQLRFHSFRPWYLDLIQKET